MCWLPELPPLEPIDRSLRAVLCDLHSVCVSVWCWALAHLPGKREAAEYHLARLTSKYGR